MKKRAMLALSAIAIAIISPTTAIRTTAQTIGPVASYAFSEGMGTTTADASGNGNRATLVNGTAWTAGVLGNGVTLDGVNDSIQLPATASLALGAAFTFETWISPANLSANRYLWVASNVNLRIFAGGYLYGAATLSGGTTAVATAFAIPANAWTHVAMTYDGATLRLYVNATLVDAQPASGTLGASPQPMAIGWSYGGGYAGALDEIRIYQRALNASEIFLDSVTAIDGTLAPQVSRTYPLANAIGVRGVAMTASFSRPMNAVTMTASTIVLTDSSNTPVQATVTYTSATQTATLTPGTPLSPLTDYTMRVAGGGAGVIDATGIPLPADYLWTFRTAASDSVPVVAYAFSEGTGTSATDSSGNGNTATLVNGTAWGAGYSGYGVTLDGINDSVLLPVTETLALGTAFTFEAWLAPANLSANRYLWRSPSVNLRIFSGGYLYGAATLSGGSSAVATSTGIPADAWTHVAMSYDGAALRLYVNGALRDTQPLGGSIAPSFLPMSLGGTYGGGYAGALDEVRLYRRALSESEIALDRATAIDPALRPHVSATYPAANAMGVRGSTIMASFSRAMNAATVTGNTVVLTDATSTAVPAMVAYASATQTATLTPAAPLASMANYTVRVSGGADGVADAIGGTMDADYTWTFRTAGADAAAAAAYAFSEGTGTTVADMSGNGNAATLVNGTAWAVGHSGNGVTLDGLNDSVMLPVTESLALDNAFTFEAWLAPANLTANRYLWVGHDVNLRIFTGGYLYGAVALTGGSAAVGTSTGISASAWTHVAMTYDGAALRLYVNGALMDAQPASGTIEASLQPMAIGWSYGGGYAGAIDEVRIYRRALTANAIAIDMATPVDPRESVISSLSPTSGLVGQAVTISGVNFGATQGATTVTFSGTSTTTTSWSDTTVVALVPAGAATGPVVVTKEGVASNPVTFTVIPVPVISSLGPSSGPAGQAVTISGSNFGSSQSSSTITFNGVSAVITSWSASSIAATLPAAATTGPVVVTVAGYASNAVTFTVFGPRISASVSPTPNSLGWNNSTLTVTFACTATDVLISFCTSPQTISFSGAAIKVTGRAIDQNGVTATMVVTLKVDLSGPALHVYSPTTTDVFPLGTTSVTIKGSAVDVLSGLSSVTCAGVSATIVGQNFTCAAGVQDGSNSVHLEAQDAAGRVTAQNVAVLVADVPPAALFVSPAMTLLLAGNTQALAVTDDRGRPVAGGAWTTTDQSVAVVTVDAGVPTVHALAAGTATVTLTRDGLSAHAAVTVLAAGAIPPDGTTLWSLLPTPNLQPGLTPGVREVVRAVPIDVGPNSNVPVPALYFVERGPYYQNADTTALPTVIRAVTADGREVWKYALPADPIFGGYSPVKQVVADDRGGIILVASSSRPACCYQMNEVIRRIDGITGLVSWEYWHREAFARFSEIAVHPNGTVFVVEKLSNADSTDLVLIDGLEGYEMDRYDLTTGHNVYPNASTGTGPLVLDDGSVVAIVSRWDNQTSVQTTAKSSWLATLPLGLTSSPFMLQPLAHADGSAVSLGIADILSGPWPDGHGGFIVGGVSPGTQSGLATAVHIGADRVVSQTVDLPFGTLSARDLQYVLSDDAGYLLLQYWPGSYKAGATLFKIDPRSLSILSSSNLTGGPFVQLTAAKADGGTLFTNHTQGDSSQIGYGLLGGWINDVPLAQTAATATVAETSWPYRRGVTSRNDATNPRLGIFVKGQFVIAPFFHTSLRIVPKNQSRWAGKPGFGRDSLGNWYLTIGAESSTNNCSGDLQSDLNRPSDLDPTILIYRERLGYPLSDEEAIVQGLLRSDGSYLDELFYSCVPLRSDDTYNSNSYTHGLLNNVGLPSPITPYLLPFVHTGWGKPVPSTEFAP